MLLQDKTALVYGAGGAVGGAVARAFARNGARVVLAGRNLASLEKVSAVIQAQGGRAESDAVDAVDGPAIEIQLSRIVERLGPINLMFNAIGWDDTQGQALVDMEFDRFHGCVATGLRTWFLTGTAVARQMIRQGGGTILGITANAARYPYAMVGGFGVACAAVEHFLRQLAVETGPQGVRVCFVRSAGSPDAPGLQEVFRLQAKEKGIEFTELLREAGSGSPLRHLPSLDEVADAAVLLASDLARGMTATMANVTCGAQVD